MASVRLVETPHDEGKVVQFSHTRTHLGWPTYWASSYWVDGVLIDTGPRLTFKAYERRLGSRKTDVIWVTHHHEDHVGSIGPLQSRRQVEALASAEARRLALSHPPLPRYRRHVWGEPEPGRLGVLPRRVETSRHSFEVVAVPGHSPRDVAFVEESQGWAFVGDLYLSARQVVTRPKEDFCATLRSLQRVLSYQPRLLFTGRRVFKQASQVVQERIVFLKQVLQGLEQLRKEGLTRVQVRRKLFGHEGFLHYWSCGDFSKQNLVDQAYGCLDASKFTTTRKY